MSRNTELAIIDAIFPETHTYSEAEVTKELEAKVRYSVDVRRLLALMPAMKSSAFEDGI